MSRRLLPLLTIALLLSGVQAGTRVSAGATDTRLLSQPAVSADHVAFVYAGDLWSATLTGADVRRLTTSEGDVTNPAFAPDGQAIAFSADFDGNTDVYLVPVGGGAPKRLTWHPGADLVQGFTPDGKAVVFTSARNVFTNRFTQLFTVPVTGGVETPLPIPNAARAAYSSDGRRIAYNPLSPAFAEWKRYRGGRVSTINVFDVQSHTVEAVAQPATRANDADPMWLGDTLYFRSDRDGEFNLFSYDRSKQLKQLTRHHDFPVLNAAAGGGHIVYEQAGYLHLFDPATGASHKLTFAVPSDLRETRERFVRGSKWIQSATLSPSGARAAFEFRGDIVTVPAEKGDVRNLTASAGVHERAPVWSPDGVSVAYFSDESGENQLVVAPQDGKGAPKSYPVEGHGFYEDPVWAPDSQRISYVDNSQSVYWIDLKTGRTKKIASQQTYTPASQLRHAWSPDSKWIAYTIGTRPLVMTVSAYSIDQDKSFPITDGLAEVTGPAFDRSGKYLYFFGSTDAGPLLDWFSQASSDMRETRNVYLAVLRKDLPSPLARESDEESKPKPPTDAPEPRETPKDAAARPGSAAAPHGGGPTETAKPAADATPFRIDLDDIQYRILDAPIPGGDLSNLQAGNAGQFYFIRQIDDKPVLQRFDLEKRKPETVLPDVSDYRVSADGKKLLYRSHDSWFIVPTTREVKPGEGKIGTDSIEVKVNPRAEWNEIFSEAWRVNRDYFYDPGMHGVDWKAARAKYAALLPEVTTRSDLNRVMQWMTSELSVGHHRITDPGDVPAADHPVPGGLLGADYSVENGRYRFAKVYGGLNWTPQLRAPLTEPGVNVKAGEYLLSVNGRDVRPTANLFSFFENTAGKIVEITVGPNADGSGSRTVQVVPVGSEGALRNRAWVEGNLRKVDKATDGKVAYVYVPNTAEPGHAYFKRYFYPQAHKDAVIVDERFNGGGQVADYYIDILRRPLISYWAMRYGADLKTPTASIQGPKVMIIDETAGSGGDLLPWMFRKLKLGPIVGKRTWGGLVGILGFPDFIDGGGITAPNLAIWTEDGWIVENEGVPPDVEVEQTPADVIAGRDPQLEKAIAMALDELKKHPPATPVRPPYKKLTVGGSR
jgi:tricorn protease